MANLDLLTLQKVKQADLQEKKKKANIAYLSLSTLGSNTYYSKTKTILCHVS